MKRNFLFSAIAASGILFMMTSCIQDHCERTQTFKVFNPIFASAQDIQSEVTASSARELENPGKIYFYQNYLLVNEVREGIHIINNADPSNPQNVGFIEIKGNLDMAVANGILYADMYTDLLSIDITDPLNPSLVNRANNTFEQYYPFVEGQGFIVDYEETDVTETIDCNDGRFGSNWIFSNNQLLIDSQFETSFDQSNSSSTGNVSIAGSMARFTIAKNHLYTLDQWRMNVFNLDNPGSPALTSTVDVAGQIETIFPQGDYLFIGANNGMFIYDNTTPQTPEFISQFQHANACDPVFVYGDYAFVTLRDGNRCENFNNELDIVDISDIRNPFLVRAYQMQNPHGLSVTNDVLYLCDGADGLKIFDATDVERITNNQLSHIKGVDSYDIIVLPYNNVAMLIGADGLYQYDASDPSDLKQLSRIPVK